MSKCVVCHEREAAVPDRERPGRPIKRVCRVCHAARLTGDLRGILQDHMARTRTTLQADTLRGLSVVEGSRQDELTRPTRLETEIRLGVQETNKRSAFIRLEDELKPVS